MVDAFASGVKVLPEPELCFGHNQRLDDPRQGLFLFGPLADLRNPKALRIGVIGTPTGLQLYQSWARAIRGPVLPSKAQVWAPFFPGFLEVFGAEWPDAPSLAIVISPGELSGAIRASDRHQGIYDSVSLFVDPIKRRAKDDDTVIDLWFVVVPDEVHLFGRPLSRIPSSEQRVVSTNMDLRLARKLTHEPSLFDEDMHAAKPYYFDTNFHHQLKIRLAGPRVVSQIVRESTLEPFRGLGDVSIASRRMEDASSIAWNLSTSSFFKTGGRPWKLADVRSNVCYVGLTFRRLDSAEGNACCGAQMFMDSGDGLVFKGAVGPWYSESTKTFHLSSQRAEELMTLVLDSYEDINGRSPSELFVHGRIVFNDDEWSGFAAAAKGRTNLVGVRIRKTRAIKLFRPGRFPVLRGTVLRISDVRSFVWASGYIPALATYPGWEVPNPLQVDICRGRADIDVVSGDVMSLTKLNFNSCIYGDGLPVTLRFADLVGEILTAGPDVPDTPLPFRHYI